MQSHLIVPMRNLGFIEEEEFGVCNGFTAAFIVALLSEKMPDFLEIIRILTIFSNIYSNEISEFKTAFKAKENIIEDKKFGKKLVAQFELLSKKEKNYFYFLSFFDLVSVFQNPQKYMHYLQNKKLGQHDFEGISKILCNKKKHYPDDLARNYFFSGVANKAGITNIYLDQYIATPSEWCAILEDLRQIIVKEQEQKPVVPLILTLTFFIYDKYLHRVALLYDNNILNHSNRWILADANLGMPKYLAILDEKDFEEILRHKPLPKEISVECLKNNGAIIHVQQQFLSELKNQELLSGMIHIYTAGNHPRLKKLKNKFHTFKNQQKTYLPEWSDLLKRQSPRGETLIHLAVEEDDGERVKQYVNNVDKLFLKNILGATPYYLAACHNSHSALRALIKKKFMTELLKVKLEQENAVLAAIVNNSPDALEVLAYAGVSLETLTPCRQYPIHVAVKNDSLEAMRVLLRPEFKVNLNRTDSEGYTAVLHATTLKNYRMIKLLADAGADLSYTEHCNEFSPLLAAVKYDLTEVIKLFIRPRYRVNLNKATSWNRTVAHIAAMSDSVESLKLLIAAGLDINVICKDGRTPLWYAAYSNKAEVLELLLKSGADPKLGKELPIMAAIKPNSCAALKILVKPEYKIDLNYRLTIPADEQGLILPHEEINQCTALMCAALDKETLSSAELLLQAGADLRTVTSGGLTVLHLVAHLNVVASIPLLLKPEYKGDVDIINPRTGETPAYTAVANNQFGALKVLTEYKANLNKATYLGATPLHAAVKNKNLDIITFLLEQKVNVLMEDKEGQTPITLAIQNNEWSLAKMLLNSVKLSLLNPTDNKLIFKHRALLFTKEDTRSCRVFSLFPPSEEDSSKKLVQKRRGACLTSCFDSWW